MRRVARGHGTARRGIRPPQVGHRHPSTANTRHVTVTTLVLPNQDLPLWPAPRPLFVAQRRTISPGQTILGGAALSLVTTGAILWGGANASIVKWCSDGTSRPAPRALSAR